MGDKSPKANKKQADQKKSKTSNEDAKKSQAMVAKQADNSGKRK